MITGTAKTGLDLAEVIETDNDLMALPDVILKILEMSQNDEISVDSLSKAISFDPALAGKLMKIASSPMYGLKIRSNNIYDAVMGLGVNTVKCLALSTAIFDDSKLPGSIKYNVKTIYGNILTVAATAAKIAEKKNIKNADELFLSGLLHKVGFLFLLQNYPDKYIEVYDGVLAGNGWLEEEERVFGYNHAVLGGMIIRKWRLSEELARSIENHMSIGFAGSNLRDDILRLAAVLNFSGEYGSDNYFEEKITKMNVICKRLELSDSELDEIVSENIPAVLQFAEAANIGIGDAEELLKRANREIFNTYVSIQKVFKERQELTRNILNAERERGITDAKQIAISTLSHYINNGSMIIYGQSQVVDLMVANKRNPNEILEMLPEAMKVINDSVKKMVVVLDELSELNMIDDVEFFDQSKILNIDARINERLSCLKDISPIRSYDR